MYLRCAEIQIKRPVQRYTLDWKLSAMPMPFLCLGPRPVKVALLDLKATTELHKLDDSTTNLVWAREAVTGSTWKRRIGAESCSPAGRPAARLESVSNSRCGSNMAIFSIAAAPTAWVEALPDPHLYPRRFADALYCLRRGPSSLVPPLAHPPPPPTPLFTLSGRAPGSDKTLPEQQPCTAMLRRGRGPPASPMLSLYVLNFPWGV